MPRARKGRGRGAASVLAARRRGGKMAAAAVLELQRAQSLLSTDREASIGILHSIGERRPAARAARAPPPPASRRAPRRRRC